MHLLAFLILAYLALGAACFAHPVGRVQPGDFGWRAQWAIFLDTLPQVLTWPFALWHLLRG